MRTIRKTFGQSDWCAWGHDDALIRESCERAGAELPFLGGFHDLSAQVRALLGLTYRLGLDEALERFGLDWEGPPHDALADARNLARLFMAVAAAAALSSEIRSKSSKRTILLDADLSRSWPCVRSSDEASGEDQLESQE